MHRNDNELPWWDRSRRRGAGRHRAIFTYLTTWATIALGNLGLSIAAAGVVANIAVGAALLGISALVSSAGSPQRPTTKTPQAQAVINQAVGPRVRGYGRALLGGTRAFFDSKNGILYQVIMMHSGEIDAFESFRVGDVIVTINGNGDVTTGPLTWTISGTTVYGIQIRSHVGTDGQSADALMLDGWPGVWTAQHQLLGIAYYAVRFRSPPAEVYQRVFPDGSNTSVRALARLSKVYDPRTETTAWSENASLCILDYLTHPDGYNRSVDDVDLPSFAAFADICEDAIPLAAGGTEPRYRIGGVYGLTDDPQDVLAKMRATCDAELYQTPAGKIAIRGGVWAAPTVTIRADDILSHSMEQGNNRFAAFNELKIIYTSAAHGYQSMEATSWENLADQEDRGVLSSSLDLDMVPSPSQARRLAKIHIAKSNPEWKGTIVANLSALNALGERTIRLVLPELGIDDAFFVAGFSISPDLTGVEISVLSINEASYSWTTAEEGASPPIPQDTSPDEDFPVPEGLVLSQNAGVVSAIVDDPGRGDLELEAQIRAGAGSIWQGMESDTQVTAFSSELAPGDYQVQARWRLGTTVGAWTSPLAEITVV